MKILFLGDIVGRSGREGVARYLPHLKKILTPDVVIVNGENAANGVGITQQICNELYALGVDCITTGNHVWAQREIIPIMDRDPKLLRPHNFPKGTMGAGVYVHQTPSSHKIAIINLMGRIFMDPIENPFAVIEEVLQTHRLLVNVHAIFVDFHAEATSEKMAFAHFVDGRVTAVIGTHTHIPTNDAQILTGGTGIQSDAGMCGDYDSVIGVKKAVPIHNFWKQTPTERMSPADGEATICGTFIETDERGLCARIDPVIIGPRLKNTIPLV